MITDIFTLLQKLNKPDYIKLIGISIKKLAIKTPASDFVDTKKIILLKREES